MIQRWDVITIGNLSRNRYWGEAADKPVRPALCTSTLVTSDRFRLLVDPSLKDAGQMAFELNRRTGLTPGQIDLVFLTHAHGDHHYGLRHFHSARWLAAPSVALALNDSKAYDKAVEPIQGRLEDEFDVLSTPGHTLDHHSLRVDCGGLSVVVAGDAVMTRDFFSDRQGYFNSADAALVRQTIEMLAGVADVIVPGHDNYFLTGRR